MCWALLYWHPLLDRVIQCVMISHWQGAKMATRGWGWLGSLTVSGPWPHWEWTASEGNWGAALGYNGESEGPPASSCYYCSLTATIEASVREKDRNSECTERGRKQKAEQMMWRASAGRPAKCLIENEWGSCVWPSATVDCEHVN